MPLHGKKMVEKWLKYQQCLKWMHGLSSNDDITAALSILDLLTKGIFVQDFKSIVRYQHVQTNQRLSVGTKDEQTIICKKLDYPVFCSWSTNPPHPYF